MSAIKLKRILEEKCDRLFYPGRAKRAKSILSCILNCPDLYIDQYCKEFYFTTEDGEKIGNCNFIEYLCTATDRNGNSLDMSETFHRLTQELLKRGAPTEYFF